MEPEVSETTTAFFLMALYYDIQGNTLAANHYLGRAFRTLIYAGVM